MTSIRSFPNEIEDVQNLPIKCNCGSDDMVSSATCGEFWRLQYNRSHAFDHSPNKCSFPIQREQTVMTFSNGVTVAYCDNMAWCTRCSTDDVFCDCTIIARSKQVKIKFEFMQNPGLERLIVVHVIL